MHWDGQDFLIAVIVYILPGSFVRYPRGVHHVGVEVASCTL